MNDAGKGRGKLAKRGVSTFERVKGQHRIWMDLCLK